MLLRSVVLAIVMAFVFSGPALGQESCIGQHTPTGMQFSGFGSMISEPIAIQEGVIFAASEMSAAGAIQLVSAAGDTILLRNEINPGPITEAPRVWTSGQYYLVVDFFSEEGSWVITVEQPVA